MTEADKIAAFFSDPGAWRAELSAFRKLLLESGLTETFKWSSPVYTAHGGNVAILWGFKDGATLGFFKGVLLSDPAQMLVAPGENSRSSRMVKVTSLAEIERLAPALRATIAEAVENERLGKKVDFPKDDLEMPEELRERLDGDPALAEAFAALTPGRRRAYFLHISGAKQSATRSARVEKHVPRILAGKGLMDR